MIAEYPYHFLPRMTRAQARVPRLVRRRLASSAGAARSWAHRCLGQDFAVAVVDVCTVTPERAAALERELAGFTLEGPAGREVALALEARLAATVAAAMVGAATPAGFGRLTPGERGLLALGVAWLLAGLDPPEWRLSGAPPSAARYERGVQLEAWVCLGSRRAGRAWLLLTPAELARLERHRQARLPRRLGGLQVTASVELGRFGLALAELRLLAPGDVVVPPPAACHQARVVVGRGFFAAEIDGARVTITSPYFRGEPMDALTDTDRGSAGEAGEGGTLVDELEVELVAELGRVELGVAEIAELQVGDVVTLRRPLRGLIDLRVASRTVGRGELVDVEGEVGIRLVEVYLE